MKIHKIVCFLCFLLFANASVAIAGNKVEFHKKGEIYQLLVNGKEFYVKGVGVGKGWGKNGENYLQMAKELGANTVRTWGIDQTPQEFLDEAVKLGLYVDAGFWLNFVPDPKQSLYSIETEYKITVSNDIIQYVKKYKDNPSILFWNVGNEVFYNIKSEKERVAFAKYLNAIAVEIKKLDPDHPILYTSANITGIKYIRDYAPAIDVFGMNLYGSIAEGESMCRKEGLNRPILITELGPQGFWSLPKDGNGVTSEPNDVARAQVYKNYMLEALALSNTIKGIFVFHLGETTQDSLTFWNLNFGPYRRASYWEIYKIYTGNTNVPDIPKIKRFGLSKNNNIKPGEALDVDLTVLYPEADSLEYEFFASTITENVMEYYVNQRIELKQKRDGDTVTLQAPQEAGKYKVYALVKDKFKNAAVQSVSIKVD